MATRVPPNQLDAEGAVLSAILLKPEPTLDEVRALLQTQYFYSDANRHIFASMLACADALVPVDIVTVTTRLKDDGRLQQIGGTPYLYQLADATPAIGNVLDHARIVRECWRVRRAIETGHQIAAEGYGPLGDGAEIQQWLEQAEQKFYEIAQQQERKQLRPVADVLQEAQTNISAAQQRGNAISGVPTGFRDLDALTSGAQEGDLIIMAGRPGMGKSAGAMNMAVRVAAAGYAVPIFSLEMPAIQVGMRLLSTESKVDLKRMREGKLQSSDWNAITQAMATLAALPIWIDDTPALSVFDLRGRLRRLKADLDQGLHPNATQRKIGIGVIDYLQLMTPPNVGEKGASREQQVAGISRMLKEIAKALLMPVLAVSQLNRQVEQRQDKRPQLSDLRESGSLEQDADTVIFLYRPEYYDKKNDPALKGWCEWIVEKQRNGPTGTIKLRFQNSCTRFDDLAEGDGYDFFDPRDTQATYAPPRNDDDDAGG